MADPAPPRYLPFDGRAYRLRMGLRPLDPTQWLEVDAHRDADLAEKSRLLRDHHQDVVALAPDPDGRARRASEELRIRLHDHLGRLGIDLHHRLDDAGLHPIDAAGRLTQEDWCLHLPDGQGTWRLVAASVCFPTRWDLSRKIGRTIREIHAPVPLYEEQLADPMDRFFSRMTPDHGVWRLNWNLLADPALHQRGRTESPTGAVRAETAGEQVWVRVERQTLVKLPRSGAIVFSIRIHQDRLGSLRPDAEARGRLERSLRAMPPPVWEDKGLASCGDQILEWLDAQAGDLR